MTPAYNQKRSAAVPFETGIHFRRKTDFFPEEDTTKSYSGFEPEPTRLQAESHSHHTGWATYNIIKSIYKNTHINDEVHFWLNASGNKQNCRIWSEANPQVYVETPLRLEKLTVWCALWAGGTLLQKR
ncbi:hypothetical protein TNCV_4505441 [Trichonephila clavipes]|nr:hypothetical protein TNCV_4505441 [Trichonephila clavipes]